MTIEYHQSLAQYLCYSGDFLDILNFNGYYILNSNAVLEGFFMKNSIKKLIFVLVVMAMIATLAFALVACGDKETQTQTTPPTAEDAPSSGGDTPSTGGDTTHVHAYGSWSITRSATCSVEGLKTRRCSKCGNVETETIPKTAHTPVTDDAVEATCTQEGKTQGSHCGVCGATIVAQRTVAKKNHTPVIDAAVEATCMQEGKTQGSHCGVCGTVIVAQTKVDKTSHTIVIDQAIPATCTEPGKTQGSHCDVCKTVLEEQQETRALGHKATQQYGSDENGHWTKCERCDEHLDPQSHVFVKLSDSYDATCQHQGYLHEKCNVCNKEKTETILAGDHRYVDGICADCRNIDPLAVEVNIHYADNEGRMHSQSTYAAPDNNFSVLDRIQLNLTSTPNYYYYFAGWFYDEYYEQPVPEGATFHEDCDIYGWAVVEYYSRMKYAISSNEVTLNGMDISRTNIVAVPPRINGYPVTAIGTEAFKDKTQYRSIILNDDLKTIGDKAFYGCNSLLSIAIPDDVTSIGAYAFYNCSGLSEITIPDSVTSIGDLAFSKCTGLQAVNWNATNCTGAGRADNTIFKGCTGLTTLNIGENVKSIPNLAFYGCQSVSKVNHLGTLKSWCEIEFGSYNTNPLFVTGGKAELYCNGEIVDLTNLNIPVGTTKIGDYAFYKLTDITSVTIPDGMQSIGNSAFYGCTGLQTVTLGEGVQSIGEWVFYNCTGLQTVTIGKGVKSIGDCAFGHCTGLRTVNWNATNCTEAGWWSSQIFRGCTEFTTLNIGENVQSIPSYAFKDCTGLQTITIPDSVQSIGLRAFYECTGLQTATINAKSIGEYAFLGCEGLQTVTIGEGVQSIGDEAFESCTGLKEIALPDSVQSIGEYAFSYCTGLQTATINAKSIGYEAFKDCTSLQTVTIGENVQSIGDLAFYECTGLQTINWYATKCTKVGERKYDYNKAQYSDYTSFKDCTILATVNIGETVQSIPALTFYGRKSITKVNYLGTLKGWCEIEFGSSSANPLYEANSYKEGSAKLYLNDEEVVTVEDLDGLESIPTYAFYGCTGIRTVIIPDSVQSIGEYAFYHCTGINKVNYLGDLKGWCEIEFESKYANPLSATYYNDNYYGRAKLYLNDVEVTGDVNIPVGTIKIGDYAFYGLTGITSVTFPDSVISIGDWAFNGCRYLRTVTIGKGVQSIGAGAFYDCKGLEHMYYAGSSTQWGNIEKGGGWNQASPSHGMGSSYTIYFQMHYNSTGPEAASNISALPSDQPVLIACDKLDLWVKQD